jgi:BMFP domain-containing protein YqiC
MVRRFPSLHGVGAVDVRSARARIGRKTESDRTANFARLDRIGSAHEFVLRRVSMLNSKAFDDLAARIGKAIENSPAKDVEKNVRAMISSGLSRLDVVPRAEFEVQAQVLLKTREKVEALEARLAEIEKRLPASSPE